MFYRQGGSTSRINAQQDTVFTDTIGDATGWLPVNAGDTIGVNISRAVLEFQSSVQSRVLKTPISPEATVILEMKQGGDRNDEAAPIDQWQNLVVSAKRPVYRAGFVRLRVANINSDGGTVGVSLALQVNRTGNAGIVA